MRIAVLALVVGVSLLGAEIGVDLAIGPVRYRSQIGEMAEEEVVHLAQRLLGPSEVVVGEIVVYREEADRRRLRKMTAPDISYEHWRNRFEQRGGTSVCPAVMIATKITDDVVLRAVDRDCKTTRRVIAGKKDPLFISVGEVKVELLFIGYHTLDEGLWDVPIALSFFVRTPDEPDERVARDFLKVMKDLLPDVPELDVTLRPDSWFIQDVMFPLWYPFDGRPSAIPSKEEYEIKQVTCVDFEQWPIQCH